MTITVQQTNVNDSFSEGMQQPQLPSKFGDPSDIVATAQDMISIAQEFMTDLMAAGWFTAPSINPTFPVVGSAPTPVTTTTPSLQNPAWTVPAQPNAFSVLPPNVSNLLPGAFDGSAPSLSFGTIPSPDYGTAPGSPALDFNYVYPTLDVSLPGPPTLLTIENVAFSPVSIPTIDNDVPTLTVMAPNIIPYGGDQLYTSTLLTMLQNDLTQALTDGTYLTLTAAAQQALWDAAREREYRQQADALAELDRMEALGYAFPPGVFIDARLKVQTETNNTIAGLSRDIMAKQAELQLENLTKAREQATTLEARLMDYTNAVAQRAFENAKLVAETAVQIYNAQVEAYGKSLEGYNTTARIYEAQLKGAEIQLEEYKTQLEGEKTKVDMNSALVQQFHTEVEVQMMVVDIFKAELGAIETQANIQKIIVEAFSEQIKAYVAQINAFTAKVEAYKAQIESQGVIENVYKTQVEAYAATVNAGAQEATALIEGFKAQVSAYDAQLNGYKAAIEGMAAEVKAAGEYNQAAAAVYSALVQGNSAYNNVLTEQWKAVATIGEQEAEVAVKALEAQAQLYVSTKNIAVEASKGAAQVAAQLGAAALNAIHFSNSASWSSAASSSYSEAISGSISSSVSQSSGA